MALLIKMKVFMVVLIKNQQEIRPKVFIKIFLSLLMKNQQEIGSNLLMIFLFLLTKKSTRNRF